MKDRGRDVRPGKQAEASKEEPLDLERDDGTPTDLALELASLTLGLEPDDPPDRLWQKIEAELNQEGPPLTRTVRAQEGRWRKLKGGVEKKDLFSDPKTGQHTFLLRLAPGATLPRHDHARAEECLVLEGAIRVAGLEIGVGDYHVALPGSVHEEIFSIEGALILLRV
ncbi:MAG: cupin domain-containing protein [Geminicoccaceae bacterium]